MKILIIYPFPPPVHGFSMMGKIARKGLGLRHEVTAIDAALNKQFCGNKLPPLWAPKRLALIVKRLTADFRIFFSTRFDVVYMGVGMGFRGIVRYLPYMLAARMRRIPYVLHIHDSTFRKTYENCNAFSRYLLKNIFGHAAGVIVLGESLRPMLHNIVDREKTYVCENAIEDFLFAGMEQISEKKEHRTPPCRLLFLSNLMRAKGILELMDAFSRTTDTVLELAGAIEPDPKIKTRLDAFLQAFPDRVRYHGPVQGEKKRELFLQADIFILPSYNEGQSVTILEAYACGCTVITDERVGGLKDIFRDGRNGAACRYGDASSIVDAIARCRSNLDYFTDTNYRQSNHYSIEKFTERLERILTDAIRRTNTNK